MTSASNDNHRAPPPYAPSLASPEALDRCTVGHERLLETVLKGLRATLRDGGARFELLVGPSGAGKTHLLRTIHQRLRRGRGASKARLVLLDERAVLGSVSDLLARAIDALQPTAQQAQQDDALRLAQRLDAADAFELLEGRLAELCGDRPLLLFVEGLGDLLEAAGTKDQHRLRATLQNRARWSLVTTGCKPSTVFTHASAPLFGTFALRTLPPLSPEPCQELRACRGEGAAPSVAGTRVLHHLLGGWPRPLVLAQQTGIADADPAALVLALADRLEPELGFVQDQLPRGRGSVLDAIGCHARPISPSALTEQLYGTSASSISAQLKILRDDGVVVAHRVGRSSYYELASPAHQLVAARRARPAELACLARFLGAWYGGREDEALGGRGADRVGDALLALDLPALAGLDPAPVETLRRALRLRDEASQDLPAALAEAAHAYAQASAPERRLLDQCLAGLDRADLLAELLR